MNSSYKAWNELSSCLLDLLNFLFFALFLAGAEMAAGRLKVSRFGGLGRDWVGLVGSWQFTIAFDCEEKVMGRTLRADEAGGIYHALNRGNGRQPIF